MPRVCGACRARPSLRLSATSHELANGTGCVRNAHARCCRRASSLAVQPLVTYARIPRSAALSTGFLRMTKARNPRDGLSRGRHVFCRDGAQRPSPNDSRNGSMRRALTVLLESWVNDSRDKALPRGAQSRRRVSAVRRWRAIQTPHTTGVVSRAQSSPCGRYGASGEQKHLPDRHTPSDDATTLQRTNARL